MKFKITQRKNYKNHGVEKIEIKNIELIKNHLINIIKEELVIVEIICKVRQNCKDIQMLKNVQILKNQKIN